jgi:hypothetical protein
MFRPVQFSLTWHTPSETVSSYYSYLRRYFPTLFELVFET